MLKLNQISSSSISYSSYYSSTSSRSSIFTSSSSSSSSSSSTEKTSKQLLNKKYLTIDYILIIKFFLFYFLKRHFWSKTHPSKEYFFRIVSDFEYSFLSPTWSPRIFCYPITISLLLFLSPTDYFPLLKPRKLPNII